MRLSQLMRTLSGSPLFLQRQLPLSKNNFGIHMVRWPYDPALNAGGARTSVNASRWPKEYDGSVGYFRAFDPNMCGRLQNSSFVQVGMTQEGSPVPYGRLEGGTWYDGILRSDGSIYLDDLEFLIKSCEAKGVKVILTIMGALPYYDFTNNRYTETPLPTGEFWSLDPDGYSKRQAQVAWAVLSRFGNRIAGIEVANEPGRDVRLDIVVPGSTQVRKHAVTARIWYDTKKKLGLTTEILSPPFQGGEVTEVATFLNASCAGITVLGSSGEGRTGKDVIDAVCHHLYGNFSNRAVDTTIVDGAAYNSPEADQAYPGIITFTDIYAKGVNVVLAARGAGWKGKFYDTEFNLTGAVGTNLWTPQKMTTAGWQRCAYLLYCASVLSGFSLHILYAHDHPALGTFDNTGTVPAGEPATWYFKAPDNTATRAAAVASVIQAVIGTFAGGTLTNGDPFISLNGDVILTANNGTNGVFVTAT